MLCHHLLEGERKNKWTGVILLPGKGWDGESIWKGWLAYPLLRIGNTCKAFESPHFRQPGDLGACLSSASDLG